MRKCNLSLGRLAQREVGKKSCNWGARICFRLMPPFYLAPGHEHARANTAGAGVLHYLASMPACTCKCVWFSAKMNIYHSRHIVCLSSASWKIDFCPTFCLPWHYISYPCYTFFPPVSTANAPELAEGLLHGDYFRECISSLICVVFLVVFCRALNPKWFSIRKKVWRGNYLSTCSGSYLRREEETGA